MSPRILNRKLWVLSYTPDFWVPVYRHNNTGTLIPFAFMDLKGVTNPTEIPRVERASLISNPHMLSAIDALEREFTYLGFIGESDFKSNLQVIFDAVPKDSRALVILNKEYYGKHDVEKAAARPTINVNRWTADVAKKYENVELLPITSFIQSPEDIGDDHYHRMVYFRMFNYIKECADRLDTREEIRLDRNSVLSAAE
jgi:hypothetical protein